VLLWKLFPSLYNTANPISRLMDTFLFLNVILAAFNLIPIFPLDGSHIVEGLLPENLAEQWEKTYRFGFIILLILMVTGGLHFILMPMVSFVTMLVGAPFLLGR
jgi:Zn-dependent protease